MSLYLDGTNYYFGAADRGATGNSVPITLAAGTTPWSVGYWYLPTSVSSVRFCLTFYSLANTDRLSFGQNTATLMAQSVRSGATNNRQGTSGTIKAGRWHHALFTNDGTTWKIYSNGVLLNSGNEAVTAYSNVTNLIVGSSYDFTTSNQVSFAAGLLCEIGIWSEALQRDAAYRLGNGESCDQVQTRSLVYYLPARNRSIAENCNGGKINELINGRNISSFGGNVAADGSPVISGDPPMLLDGDITRNSAIQYSFTTVSSTTYAMTIADGYIFSDVAAPQVIGSQIQSDGSVFSDVQTSISTLRLNASDGYVFSNTTSLNATTNVIVSDGTLQSDTLAYGLLTSLQFSDGYKFSDLEAQGSVFFINCSDAFVAAEMLATALASGKISISEVTVFSDASQKNATATLIAAESSVFSDTVQAEATAAIRATDGSKFSETPSLATTGKISTSDSELFSDTLLASLLVYKTFSDSQIYSDSQSLKAVGSISKTDGLLFSNAVSVTSTGDVSVTDTTLFHASFELTCTFGITLADQLQYSDLADLILYVIPLFNSGNLDFFTHLSSELQFDIKTTDWLYWSVSDEDFITFKQTDEDDVDWNLP